MKDLQHAFDISLGDQRYTIIANKRFLWQRLLKARVTILGCQVWNINSLALQNCTSSVTLPDLESHRLRKSICTEALPGCISQRFRSSIEYQHRCRINR